MGQKIPIGTVATLLYNIRAYDALKAQTNPTVEDMDEMMKLEDEMTTVIPLAKEIGLFDLFDVDE